MEISHEFNAKELIFFSLPSIIMMVFESLYTIVDGAFVSSLVSTDALSSINLVWPIIGIVYALAVMFGIGGTSVVSRTLGEGKKDLANGYFTVFYLLNVIVAVSFTVIVMTNLEFFLSLVGLDEATYTYGKTYLSILLMLTISTCSQKFFQPFFISASRPRLGLTLIVSAGIFNVIFDYVFIKFFNLGIAGAALATVLGQSIPLIGGLIFFSKRSSNIHFAVPKFDFRIIKKGLANGSGEMIISLSTSLVTFLFNTVMLSLGGADAVAGICTIQYMHFFYISIFQGYSLGVQPIMAYNHGAKRRDLLHYIYKASIKFLFLAGIFMMVLCFVMSKPIAYIYASSNQVVFDYVVTGLRIYTVGIIFSSMNIFHIGVYQALNNGRLAAFISFARSFIFLIIGTFGLSYLFKINGVFMALPFSEIMALLIVLYFQKYLKEEFL